MIPDNIQMNPLQVILLMLACWFFLALGVLIGHFTWPRCPDSDEAGAEAVSTEPTYTHPRGAHRGPPTTEFQLPLRRADDRLGVPPAAPRPGGRRRADGPPLTRAQARQLREKGWYDDGPASRS